MKSREQKLNENLADVMANGPRLSYNRNTWILAKSECGNYVFLGGLGGMGVGEMWCVASDTERTDPEWQTAPVHRYVPNHKDLGHCFRIGEKVSG